MSWASAASSTKQVTQPHTERLAGFDVVGRHKIGIRQEKDAGASGGFVGLVEAMQRTRDEAAQHRLEMRQARSERRFARAAVRCPFGRQRRGLILDALGAIGFARRFGGTRGESLRLPLGLAAER
jgi:hypothetical protein